MLKLGDKNITKLYYGDKSISKAYCGDKLVFQAGKPIFLDYIESDGRCCIDTGIKPNQDTTVNITWSESSEINYGTTFFGTRDSSSPTNAFVFWGAGAGYWRDQYGNQNFTSTIPRDTKKHTLIKDKNKTYLDGELFKEHTYTEFNCSHNMYLFCINEGGVANYQGDVKIYSCLIYDNGVLVRDLRPCIHPTTKQVGFYDLVTNQYFFNAGAGTLKAGGRFVKSILFDGASYIDTGVQYQTCTIKTEIKFYPTGTRQLMGFSGSSPIHYWGCSESGVLNPLTSVNGLEFNEIEIAYNKNDVDNKTLTITADGKSAVKTGKIDTTKSYLIGCLDTSFYFAQCEVKYNEIYINGELIQDLRPYVDSDGVACFKDIVTGNLFYNQGTGTLGYTEE